MPSPSGNSSHLVANLAAEAAKLEKALDEQIGKLGTIRQVAEEPSKRVRFRKATVLLLCIGFTLACLTAFSFGFIAGFH